VHTMLSAALRTKRDIVERLSRVVLFAAFAIIPCAAQTVPFPCSIADFRIPSKRDLYLRCQALPQVDISGEVTAVKLNALGLATAATITGHVDYKPGQSQPLWLAVKFDGDLESDASYKLLMQDKIKADDRNIEPKAFNFDTAPAATIDTSNCAAGFTQCFFVLSNIGIDWTPAGSAKLGQNPKTCDSIGPIAHFEDLSRRGIRAIGTGYINFAGSVRLEPDVKLCAAGLRDVLGGEIALKGTYKEQPAPKDKASAQAYAKLLSQAGPGAKPGWAADVRLAPNLFNLGHRYYFSPEALVDVGFGSKVEDTKSTNTIKIAAGVTKPVVSRSDAAPLQALNLTPRIAFETDRKGHHQNLLFDFDSQLFWKGLLHSREAQRKKKWSTETINVAKAGKDMPKLADYSLPKFGWQLQTFLGTEIGGALSSDMTKSQDEATSVLRPTYDIARLRPRVAGAVEFGMFEVTFMAVPRYLFTAEKVTSEQTIPDPKDATKTISQIYVKDAKGFRPYGEVSLNISVDRAGHFAISSTYKLGSVPPNFDYVSTVQTGILLRY
jgi:hypothetical protein